MEITAGGRTNSPNRLTTYVQVTDWNEPVSYEYTVVGKTPETNVLTVFDNRSCFHKDGTEYLKLMEDPMPNPYTVADLNSRGLVYAVDLKLSTVEMIDVIDFPIRSEFACSIFEIRNYYCACFNKTREFLVYDTDHKTGVRIRNLNLTFDTYRARILTFDQLAQFAPGYID